MTISRTAKTPEQLDDEAVVGLIRGFVTVQAADWRRRQLNVVLPRVFRAIDEARARGDAPDVKAILKQVWVERDIPALDKA